MKVKVDGREISVKRFNFSGGEVQVRLEDIIGKEYIIEFVIRSSDDIMALLLICDAIRNISSNAIIRLVCPYFPYARQDRVVYNGEAFSARVMANLLNGLEFKSIEFWDIHSTLSLELTKKSFSKPASDFVSKYVNQNEFIVAPDYGAYKRAKQCSDITGNPLLQMSKSRDPNTGYLSLFKLETNVSELDKNNGAIIIDDICDGGRTFIGGAKVLRQHLNGPLRLYVTHGIFSSGFDGLLEVFDEILVANLMTDIDLPNRVKII